MSTAEVRDARRAALTALIDDAALFPPARLPMAAALEGHARHRQAAHRWMVGRFLCPASRLSELTGLLLPDQRIAMNVILDGASRRGAAAFAETVSADLDASGAAASDARVTLSGFEVRLPPDARPTAGVDAVVRAAAVSPLRGSLHPFLEIPLAGQPPASVNAAVEALADVRASWPSDAAQARLTAPAAKVRCGGVTPDAFPTPEELGAFVAVCAEHGVPFKATAGLHHPLRHKDATTGVTQHGFVNLLAAAALARLDGDAAPLTAVLDERDPAALRLDAAGLQVAGQQVDAATLAAVRGDLLLAYGSCSIDEPVEDLIALGVLSREAPELILEQ